MRRLILFCAVLCFAFSCEDGEPIEAPECPQDIACTKIYITLHLEITDAQGRSYKLDEFYTTRISTGEKVLFHDQNTDGAMPFEGFYPILGDGQLGKTTRSGEEFQFTGIKDGKEVVTKKFVIGHDCCHVKLVSGDTKISIP